MQQTKLNKSNHQGWISLLWLTLSTTIFLVLFLQVKLSRIFPASSGGQQGGHPSLLDSLLPILKVVRHPYLLPYLGS